MDNNCLEQEFGLLLITQWNLVCLSGVVFDCISGVAVGCDNMQKLRQKYQIWMKIIDTSHFQYPKLEEEVTTSKILVWVSSLIWKKPLCRVSGLLNHPCQNYADHSQNYGTYYGQNDHNIVFQLKSVIR